MQTKWYFAGEHLPSKFSTHGTVATDALKDELYESVVDKIYDTAQKKIGKGLDRSDIHVDALEAFATYPFRYGQRIPWFYSLFIDGRSFSGVHIAEAFFSKAALLEEVLDLVCSDVNNPIDRSLHPCVSMTPLIPAENGILQVFSFAAHGKMNIRRVATKKS